MSKYTFLIDPGHGGMISGKYQTAGKRSPKFEDGSQLFEGVNNRDNAKRLIQKLKEKGIDAVDIVNSEQDISLSERVNRANKLHKNKKCVYISLHSDAAGNGIDWHPASGISVYTSKGQTKSDQFAELAINYLRQRFGDSVKWRVDTRDGDQDKEENFYVLKGTNCPAILFELGFHTNKEETKRMMTDEFKNKALDAITDACMYWELNF